MELGKRAGAAERSRQVCDIAIKLFLEHGYDNTPMSLIAKEAGLTKAGIYHHFESKQHLLHAVHKQLLEERLRPIILKAREIAKPQERLRTFIMDLCLLLTSDFAARILVSESRGLSPEQFTDIGKVWKEELNLVRDAIVELGEIHARIVHRYIHQAKLLGRHAKRAGFPLQIGEHPIEGRIRVHRARYRETHIAARKHLAILRVAVVGHHDIAGGRGHIARAVRRREHDFVGTR